MAPRVVRHESLYFLRLFLRVVEQRLRARSDRRAEEAILSV